MGEDESELDRQSPVAQIRNSKLETRNKPKRRKREKTRNSQAWPRFEPFAFGFRYCFGLRVSGFGFGPSTLLIHPRQLRLDAVARLGFELKIAVHLPHSFAVPVGKASAEIVADPDQAISPGDDAEPRRHVVLAPGGDFVPVLGAQVVKRRIVPAPRCSGEQADDARAA